MDRLLSEQEVIKAVNKHTIPSAEIILSEDITAILKEVSSAEPKWIPVSEGLPEERKTITGPDVFIDPSEEVLVQMKSGYMKVSRYWGSRERYRNRPWIDLDYPTTDEVVAWRPLPERFKVESEDRE